MLYPLILFALASGKKLSYRTFEETDELPVVYIVIPVHNEEKVIGQKIESILSSSYPENKLTIYVGLDNCTDATKAIVDGFGKPFIQVIEFPERKGKPGILNSIVEKISVSDSILILTDADIKFRKNTIYELVKYFKDDRIGLVDSDVQVLQTNNPEEKQYAGFETNIKRSESLVFGKILGPSGGCYAIRRSCFSAVPANFLVDDFYIGMEVVLKNKNTLLNTDAVCTEEKNTTWSDEYNRKIRIATGCFQNLWRYKKLLLQLFTATGFIFLSHKVLRWKTPFLLLIVYGILVFWSPFVILIITFFLPFFVLILGTLGWRIKPLYAFLYFVSMNMAVMTGFFNFLKGVPNNVWQPTSR
jgi:cellulose synthase/poly-beta-1,6-N-acetylglucosamine synthase-like glycosyltransferase